MNTTNKTQTSTEKFEELFTTLYADKISELIIKYPDDGISLIVNYQDLEIFDPELADLLIEKPEEVISAAKIAIKNTESLSEYDNINIRFENVTNIIPLKDIKSHHIGIFCAVEGRLKDMTEPRPRIDIGVFECRGCMRLHEVEQTSANHIIEPSICSECGGRSFRLLQKESKYIDTQTAILTYSYEYCKTSKELLLIFEDDLALWDVYYPGQLVRLAGTLSVFREEKTGQMKDYLYVNHVEFLEDVGEHDYFEEQIEYDETGRNTPQYNAWVSKVLNRDNNICQCCGTHKYPEAHHIYGYKNYPELRLDEHNGITLCKWCHGKYHSHYGIRNANPIDLMDFFSRFGKTNNHFPQIKQENILHKNLDIKSEIISQQEYEYPKNFMKIIKQLSDDEGLRSYKDLIFKLGSKNIHKDTVLEMISKCKQKGDIYEPIIGFVKITNDDLGGDC